MLVLIFGAGIDCVGADLVDSLGRSVMWISGTNKNYFPTDCFWI